jgi:hypothetical protein
MHDFEMIENEVSEGKGVGPLPYTSQQRLSESPKAQTKQTRL